MISIEFVLLVLYQLPIFEHSIAPTSSRTKVNRTVSLNSAGIRQFKFKDHEIKNLVNCHDGRLNRC